jgi:beta-N-acetylhexosaminidase
LREVELRPFLHTIQNGLASVMTAHVLYPNLDPNEPATLSKRIVTGLLREGMGFRGVVVTDDLEMAAISDLHGPGVAAVKAIEAGADLILFCRDEDKQREALEAVANAVKHKKISEARIEQSLLRILQMKEKYILPYQAADPAQVKEIVGSPSHKHLLEEVKERAEAPVAVKAG